MDTKTKEIESLLPLPPASFHVLMAVAESDRHGYGIIQDVEERTDGALRLSAGTLYRTLQRLVDRGLIAERLTRPGGTDDDPRRRYYRITPFGRDVARAEAARLAGLVRLARASGLAPEAT